MHYIVLVILGLIVARTVLFNAKVMTFVILAAFVYYNSSAQALVITLFGYYLLFKVIFGALL